MDYFHDEFSLSDDFVYLNHAAIAPWPTRTKNAVQAFAEQNAQTGSLYYPQWLDHEKDLRQLLAQLIHVPEQDLALVKNTSEGLSIVAHGLPWQAGDNIVIPQQEFPSNRVVWQSLADRQVEVRTVDILATDEPEKLIMDATDSHTKLLSVSSVQYGTGLVLALPALGEFCRRKNILFCVDAIQSVGCVPFDAQAAQADFVAADGHKWLLGPEGLGLFYCRATLRDRLTLHEYGWHMLAKPNDFQANTWQVACDARRFECGSPNMLGVFALHASVSLLAQVGMVNIQRKIVDNTQYLFDALQAMPGVTLLTDTRAGRFAGIVSFKHAGNTEKLYNHLIKNQIFCAQRGGGIRFSPHFYTPRSHLDRALETIRAFL